MSSGRMKLRIGTRGSHLARTQSTTVAAALQALGHETELVIIHTSGDRSTAPSFGSIGPQGVFVREIEQALLDGAVDVAVHSYKDLPTASPRELTIAAVPERLDAADVLVMRDMTTTGGDGALPIREEAHVGTSSARRQSWLRHLRPDLIVEPLRGNVPTRIRRLDEGLDAIVLAAAGIDRLKHTAIEDAPDLVLADRVLARLDPDVFVPPPAQGAFAIQCRAADGEIREALTTLDDAATRRCVDAERALLARVEGGCDVAFGAHCARAAGAANAALSLTAMLERDGEILRTQASGSDANALVAQAWEALRRE